MVHNEVKWCCSPQGGLLHSEPMKQKAHKDASGALNLRGIPKDLIYRLKMAAAAEHKTVKDLLLELIQGRIQDLERKGMLPRGK